MLSSSQAAGNVPVAPLAAPSMPQPATITSHDYRMAQLKLILSWINDKATQYQKRLLLQTKPIHDMELIGPLDVSCDDTYDYFREAETRDFALGRGFFKAFSDMHATLQKGCENALIAATALKHPALKVVYYLEFLSHSSKILSLNLYPTEAAEIADALEHIFENKSKWELFYQRYKLNNWNIPCIDEFNDGLKQLINTQKALYHYNFAHHHIVESNTSGNIDPHILKRMKKSLRLAKKFDANANNYELEDRINDLSDKISQLSRGASPVQSTTSAQGLVSSTTTLLQKMAIVPSQPQLSYSDVYLPTELEYFSYNKLWLTKSGSLPSTPKKKSLIFDMDETIAYCSLTGKLCIINKPKLLHVLANIDLQTTDVSIMTSRYFPELPDVHFECLEVINYLHRKLKKIVFSSVIYTNATSKGDAMDNEFRAHHYHDLSIKRADVILIDNLRKPNLNDAEQFGFKTILADFKGTHLDELIRELKLPPMSQKKVLQPILLHTNAINIPQAPLLTFKKI